MRITRLASAVLFAAALFAAKPSFAQVMADRLPADACIYVGWAGSDALGPAYDASHLKALLNTLNLPQYIGARIEDQMGKETDPQKIADGKLIKDWLTAMAKAPTAGYFSSIDWNPAPNPPIPHAAIISKVGKDVAAALASKIEALLHRDPAPNAPPHGAKAVDDFLVLYVGDDALSDSLAKPPAESLATNPGFKKAMAQVGAAGANPAVTLFIDTPGAIKMMQGAINMLNNPNTTQMFPALMDGMGVNSFQQIAYAGNFDGPNWLEATFVGMNDKRVGVASFFDNKPLTEAAIKAIPPSAVSAGVLRFDGMRLLSDLQNLAQNLTPQAPAQLSQGLRQIYAFTGVDIENDLFPALGDEFTYYASPDATGVSLRGLTLVNKLKDAEKADRALTALETITNLLILQRDPNSHAQFKDQPMPAPNDKVTAHVLALDAVTPAWAIKDGVLYFSLSMQGLQTAMDVTAKKESIADNPQFTALRKKLTAAGAPQQISSFTFVDGAKSAPEFYEFVVRALIKAAADNPDQKNPYTLPPLEKITPDLGPMLNVAWSDKDGFHSRETGPYPYSGTLSPIQLLFLRLGEMAGQRATNGGGGFAGPGAGGNPPAQGGGGLP